MNEKQQMPSDHDLLVRIDERTENLEKQFGNHLVHHFRYSIMAWSAVIALASALIVLLVKG